MIDGTTWDPIEYDDHAKRHVTIDFYQRHWDHEVLPPIVDHRKSHGIKQCTVDDFSRTPQM